MIGYFTYSYIKKKTHTKLNRIELNQKILSHIKIKDNIDYEIVFSLVKDDIAKLLNATKRGKYIICTPFWAITLTNDCPKIYNAFNYTVGHELSHTNDFQYYGRKNRQFINWINEVHADYMSTQYVINSNYKNVKSSIEFKRIVKDSSDKNTKSHPSWKQREIYIKQKIFDQHLIRQIANDTKCKDNKLIQQVCDYYENDIILL